MRVPAPEWARRQWVKAVVIAGELGHQVEDPEQDTEVSLVAECVRCGSLVAVDGQERPYLFGTGLMDRCTTQGVVVSSAA